MDAFTMTTPVDATITTYTPEPTVSELSLQINTLQREVERLQGNFDRTLARSRELETKISNVRGHIFDMYSMNGSVDDDIKEIAGLLDITLMKEIQGTALCEISWTAQVPLDFDADDFEISFDVNCETYEAEDFDYNEDNTEVSGEDV